MGVKNRLYKNCLFIFFFILFHTVIFSQNTFYYEWYVKGDVRDGVLIYDKDLDQALYIDLLSTQRIMKKEFHNDLKLEKGEQATIVNASTSWYDRYFYKKNNKISYTADLLKKPFLVDDSTLDLIWILKEDVKQIDGFNCKKAVVDFRGRIWDVWYTPEISMYYGPWKFYGLPGLIIAAYDSTNEFWFQLTAIKTDPNLKIPQIDKKKYTEVSLKKYDSMEDEVLRGNGLRNISGIEKQEYKRNGIELIYEWEDNN